VFSILNISILLKRTPSGPESWWLNEGVKAETFDEINKRNKNIFIGNS
jgi:hypothetical protein